MPHHGAAIPCGTSRAPGKRIRPPWIPCRMKSLAELRARLDIIDRELLQLVAERQSLGKQIAEVKRSAGQGNARFPPRTRGVAQGAPGRRSARGLARAGRIAAAIADSRVAYDPGAGSRRGAGTRHRPSRAGDRRPRQDGALDGRLHGDAGFHGDHRRSVRRSPGLRMRRRLAAIRPAARHHRRCHADQDRERRAGAAGRRANRPASSSTSARSRLRCAAGSTGCVRPGAM